MTKCNFQHRLPNQWEDDFQLTYPAYYKDFLELQTLISSAQGSFHAKFEELVLGLQPQMKNAYPCAVLSNIAAVLAIVLPSVIVGS